jgi:hypothetical protein
MKAQNFALKYREIRLLPIRHIFPTSGFPIQTTRFEPFAQACISNTLIYRRSILINSEKQNGAMTVGRSM